MAWVGPDQSTLIWCELYCPHEQQTWTGRHGVERGTQASDFRPQFAKFQGFGFEFEVFGASGIGSTPRAESPKPDAWNRLDKEKTTNCPETCSNYSSSPRRLLCLALPSAVCCFPRCSVSQPFPPLPTR